MASSANAPRRSILNHVLESEQGGKRMLQTFTTQWNKSQIPVFARPCILFFSMTWLDENHRANSTVCQKPLLSFFWASLGLRGPIALSHQLNCPSQMGEWRRLSEFYLCCARLWLSQPLSAGKCFWHSRCSLLLQSGSCCGDAYPFHSLWSHLQHNTNLAVQFAIPMNRNRGSFI